MVSEVMADEGESSNLRADRVDEEEQVIQRLARLETKLDSLMLFHSTSRRPVISPCGLWYWPTPALTVNSLPLWPSEGIHVSILEAFLAWRARGQPPFASKMSEEACESPGGWVGAAIAARPRLEKRGVRYSSPRTRPKEWYANCAFSMPSAIRGPSAKPETRWIPKKVAPVPAVRAAAVDGQSRSSGRFQVLGQGLEDEGGEDDEGDAACCRGPPVMVTAGPDYGPEAPTDAQLLEAVAHRALLERTQRTEQQQALCAPMDRVLKRLRLGCRCTTGYTAVLGATGLTATCCGADMGGRIAIRCPRRTCKKSEVRCIPCGGPLVRAALMQEVEQHMSSVVDSVFTTTSHGS